MLGHIRRVRTRLVGSVVMGGALALASAAGAQTLRLAGDDVSPPPRSGQAAAAAAPTFTKDVAPIFQDKCEACHRPDSIAPMSLVTYAETRPWAPWVPYELPALAV